MTLAQLNKRLRLHDGELRAVTSLPYYSTDNSMLYDNGTLLIPLYKIRIERRLPSHVKVIIDPPNPLQDPSDRQAALERYILLFDVWPNQMDSRIFYTLWATDMADSTTNRKAQEIVDRVKRAREKSKAEFADMVTVNAREAYRYMNAVRTLPQGYHPRPGEPCYGGMSVCD